MLLIKALDSLSMRCLAQRLCEQVILMKLTEKQKNCPYCHEGETFSGELGWVAIIRKFDSRIIAVSPTEEVCVLNVDYCPMCGRPLNEEEE